MVKFSPDACSLGPGMKLSKHVQPLTCFVIITARQIGGGMITERENDSVGLMAGEFTLSRPSLENIDQISPQHSSC